jgi:hypothetical protein
MKAFADKLIDITRHHSDAIAKEWCKAVRSNPRTPSFHSLTKEVCIQDAANFYKNLRWIYYSERPYSQVRRFFMEYADDKHKTGIPLHESIYALIMMRRHLWLYADFQKPFLTGLTHNQILLTINNTIRIFDHGIYLITQRYWELDELNGKLPRKEIPE